MPAVSESANRIEANCHRHCWRMVHQTVKHLLQSDAPFLGQRVERCALIQSFTTKSLPPRSMVESLTNGFEVSAQVIDIAIPGVSNEDITGICQNIH